MFLNKTGWVSRIRVAETSFDYAAIKGDITELKNMLQKASTQFMILDGREKSCKYNTLRL